LKPGSKTVSLALEQLVIQCKNLDSKMVTSFSQQVKCNAFHSTRMGTDTTKVLQL
jgi:hypothetical protein